MILSLHNFIDSVIKNLETDFAKMFQWFAYNAMKTNPDRSCQLLSSKNLSWSAKIDGNVITNENNVKLLGITFDNDLCFNKHISSLCNVIKQRKSYMHFREYLVIWVWKSVDFLWKRSPNNNSAIVSANLDIS